MYPEDSVPPPPPEGQDRAQDPARSWAELEPEFEGPSERPSDLDRFLPSDDVKPLIAAGEFAKFLTSDGKARLAARLGVAPERLDAMSRDELRRRAIVATGRGPEETLREAKALRAAARKAWDERFAPPAPPARGTGRPADREGADRGAPEAESEDDGGGGADSGDVPPAKRRCHLHLDRRSAELAARVASYPGDHLLRPREVAAWLAVSEPTLKRWRARGVGPRWLRCGARAIRVRKDDLVAWLTERADARRSAR